MSVVRQGGAFATHHDQIRRARLPIIAAVGIGIITLGIIVFSARSALLPAMPVRVRPVLVEFAQPTAGSSARSAITVQGPGWVEPEPFAVAATALADGVVAEMLILEGDLVQEGQPIARLIDDDARIALAAAVADVDAAQAALSLAMAEHRAAQAEWDNPIERSRAAEMAQARLDEAEAELSRLPHMIAAEQAVLDRLEEEHKRAVDARRTNAVTEFELVIVKHRVTAQAATLEAVRNQAPVLTAQRDQARADLHAAQRNAQLRIAERQALDVASARLAQARATLAQTQAKRDEANLRFSRMSITAPITGHIMRRLKAPGDKVMLGADDPRSAQVAILYDTQHIQVRVDVPLADAAHLHVGQSCDIVVEILPDQTFKGEVIRIVHEADLQKNTLQAKVRILNPSPLLRPEMLARVKFLSGEGGATRSTIADSPHALVPAEFLDDATPATTRLWAVRERVGSRGRLHPITVTVVEETPTHARIAGDVRPTDLIAEPAPNLRANARVRIIAAQGGQP